MLGIAAVLGHMFPVTRRFKGGKGVATAGGGRWSSCSPSSSWSLAVVWFLVARGLRKASIASLVCAVLFPIVVAVSGGVVGWTSRSPCGLGLLVVRASLSRTSGASIRGEEHELGGIGRPADGGSVVGVTHEANADATGHARP